MKKQIGCILCLCTVLMSGCSKEQSYHNLLNERIADALAVPLTSTDTCIKYYYSYQLREVRSFFRSEDFALYSEADGPMLLRRLERETR